MYSSIIVSESRGRGKRRGSSERNHILLYEILIQAKVDPEKASEVHNFLFFVTHKLTYQNIPLWAMYSLYS